MQNEFGSSHIIKKLHHFQPSWLSTSACITSHSSTGHVRKFSVIMAITRASQMKTGGVIILSSRCTLLIESIHSLQGQEVHLQWSTQSFRSLRQVWPPALQCPPSYSFSLVLFLDQFLIFFSVFLFKPVTITKHSQMEGGRYSAYKYNLLSPFLHPPIDRLPTRRIPCVETEF